MMGEIGLNGSGQQRYRIRRLLRAFVKSEHESAPDAVFLEEFALQGGTVRADLAALNGMSHGYEIKSARDTLPRLPAQVTAYSAVFDRATLVGARATYSRPLQSFRRGGVS